MLSWGRKSYLHIVRDFHVVHVHVSPHRGCSTTIDAYERKEAMHSSVQQPRTPGTFLLALLIVMAVPRLVGAASLLWSVPVVSHLYHAYLWPVFTLTDKV